MSVRLIDAGLLPAVRSQTIYHAIGYAMDAATPDTIVLVSPAEPYVSIGFHQDVTREVDLAFCARAGRPVIRREVGGGAVYLDSNQIFCQWIFHRDHLPSALAARFQLYTQPLIDTYRALGVAAYFRPINDIHVAGRKIGGVGAAAIGQAEIVVGSLMFDFDYALMAQVLRVSSEKMRDKLYQGLHDYMTTLARELGHTPDRQAVKELYVTQCAAALQRTLEPGALTSGELAQASELDRLFVSPAWLYQEGTRSTMGVKINADVQLVEAAHKAAGGLIRVVATVADGRLADVALSGDFTIRPACAVAALEQRLRDASLQPAALQAVITTWEQELAVLSPGVTADDWVQAILHLSPVEGTVS